MPQFDLFPDPTDENAPRITAPTPTVTRRGQYNALGLPTPAFLEQLKSAPEGDFDLDDYNRGRWLRNLPLAPDETLDELLPYEMPPDDPVLKIIPPLNSALMRAVDLGGGNTVCRPLIDGIGRAIYRDEESPFRARQQKLALHRWLRHTLLTELPELPGVTPNDLWYVLEDTTPRACPISASLHGRHLPQETHDRLWLGIRSWEKPRGAAALDDDDGSFEAEARREFIWPEQMVLSGIKPKQRATVRAAALGAASTLIAKGHLRIFPEMYHRVHDVAANSQGLVKERAEVLLEPLEAARDKAVEGAFSSMRRTIQEWYREPPR